MSAGLHMANGLREFARATPRAVAVRDGRRAVTFVELDERSSRLGAALLARGVCPGEPVAVLSGNRWEYIEIVAGLAKAGLPVVPLNPRNTRADNAYILQHCAARALVLDGSLAGSVEGLADEFACVLVLDPVDGGPAELAGRACGYERALAEAVSTDPRVPTDERDTFAIAYTSGTTGRPKGVVLTHRGRVLTSYASALEWGIGPARRTAAVAPLYHGAGLSFGYTGPFVGGTTSILRSWDPEELLTMVARDRLETLFLVPTHAQQIRALAEDPAARFDLSSLNTLFFNAAALPVALKEWLLDALPWVGVHELYGSTEAGVVTNLRPADARRKAGSVGHAWFMTEVRLLDDEGQDVPDGTPGELYSRSPYLMGGYLNDEAATRACTTSDGFVTAGDVAVRDNEGFITIVDRKKDMIVTGGVNVYPREIEEVIATYPGVVEVAVVGLPDDIWGERIAAVVVWRDGAAHDLEGLRTYVRGRVADYKNPREWRLTDALPRNPSGKVLKRELRAEPDRFAPPVGRNTSEV